MPRSRGDCVLWKLAKMRGQWDERPLIARVDEFGRNTLSIHLDQAPLDVPGSLVPARRPHSGGIHHLQGLGREVGKQSEQLLEPFVILVHRG